MAEAKDPFEDALAAMGGGDSGADDKSAEIDPFDAALKTVETGENSTETAEADPFDAALQVAKQEHNVSQAEQSVDFSNSLIDQKFLMDIKVTVTFEVGRAKMFISDLLSLGQGSVIELHRLVGEELELFVNGELIATGEVVVVNEKFGARITKILGPEERLKVMGPYA